MKLQIYRLGVEHSLSFNFTDWGQALILVLGLSSVYG